MAGKIRIKQNVQTQSFAMRNQDVKQTWHLIDAEGVILGRLAAHVATLLRGKHRVTFTPSVDGGDHVIIINAEKVKLTGNKLTDKVFFYHTGHPGGLKERTPEQILASAHPERVILKAVERMLPEGTLGRHQLTKLKVYKGAEHPHAAQTPTVIDFAARNPKNKRG